jgi:hypothetical protein
MSDRDTQDFNIESGQSSSTLIDLHEGPNLIDVLREDVIRDLQDQLRLARLYLSIPDPSPKDFQTVRPLPDPWWIQRPDGNLLFVIYCLNKPVEIRPGVAAILIEGRENLILAIKALINIVRDGRLDRALVHS